MLCPPWRPLNASATATCLPSAHRERPPAQRVRSTAEAVWKVLGGLLWRAEDLVDAGFPVLRPQHRLTCGMKVWTLAQPTQSATARAIEIRRP